MKWRVGGGEKGGGVPANYPYVDAVKLSAALRRCHSVHVQSDRCLGSCDGMVLVNKGVVGTKKAMLCSSAKGAIAAVQISGKLMFC